MSDPRPEAFVLTGMFFVVCRSPLYLAELARRGVKALVVTQAAFRDSALAARADPAHPAALVHDFAFVDAGGHGDPALLADVLAAGRAWRDAYRIVGTYAVGETLVEQTGLLADALGLRTPGLRATRACRSKVLQRFYVPELGPASVVVPPDQRDSPDVATVGFPAVVKPAGRHSSSGVAAVTDRAGLSRRLAAFPADEVVLVEERVIGQEFSVESLVQDGKAVFASVTRKETTESHGTFVELTHTVPSDRTDAQAEVLEANRVLLDALAFADGIAHSEWRVDPAGRPVLMEIAARTPGDGLMTLYHLATGVPLEPEIMRVALGEPAAYPEPGRYARQVYVEHDPGVLEDVTLDWPGVAPTWVTGSRIWPAIPPGPADGPPALRAVLVLKRPGSTLGPMSSSDDRAVTFYIDAPTPAGLDDLERRVRAALVVRTRAVVS
jgi:hypothetical protein